MNSAKEELQEHIRLIGIKLQNFPWENQTSYINWLVQTYFFVKHTPTFLLLSANKWGESHRKERDLALKHLNEELSHDQLLVNDLKIFNIMASDCSEWPETQAFYQTQYYWIEHVTPVAHLGYAYLLEGLASTQGSHIYNRIAKVHGIDTGTFLKVHSEEDVHHFKEGLSRIEGFNETEIMFFKECLTQAAYLYSQILDRAKR